jgi:transposase
MGTQILADELWSLIEPLLPPPKPRRFRNPGRKRVPDRAALTGILSHIRCRVCVSSIASVSIKSQCSLSI